MTINFNNLLGVIRPKTAGAAGSKKFSKTDKNVDGRSIKNATFEKEEVGPGTNAEQRQHFCKVANLIILNYQTKDSSQIG